jgi:carbon monoxide dehydrogenase subunit G
MKISGSYTFHAPPQLVWDSMHDPDALRACLPGLTSIDNTEEGFRFETEPGALGSETPTAGTIRVQAEEPPTTCTLAVEAQGSRGALTGHATVTLARDAAGNTSARWSGEGKLSGALGGLGGFFLGGMVRRAIEGFCASLDAELQVRQQPGQAAS